MMMQSGRRGGNGHRGDLPDTDPSQDRAPASASALRLISSVLSRSHICERFKSARRSHRLQVHPKGLTVLKYGSECAYFIELSEN
uniref:Uncharacterized protein n=1 Tax=Anguilla anguilla TaxID=7936 RepID=A0A0E9PEJ3_ANGAN